jgi:hypothetical protein
MRSIFAIWVILALCGCDPDTVSTRYATLDAAKADQLFQRGWLPDLLPTSSTKIRTNNNLDHNISEGAFSFDPAEANSFFARLAKGAPAASPLRDWEKTLRSYSSRGRSSWSFSDAGSTWAFFCDAPKGYCDYLMWTR